MAGIHQMLLAGGQNYVIDFLALNDTDLDVQPGTAQASITFDGATADEGGVLAGTIVVFGDPATLEVSRNAGTGNTPTGPDADEWNALDSGLAGWFLSRSSPGQNAWDGSYTIRVIATGEVLGSGSLSLTATVSEP